MKTIFTNVILVLILINCNAQKKELDIRVNSNVITFKSNTHNFGKIKYNSKAEHNFIFKNISGNPVQITSVLTSCGCSTPHFPSEPIKRRGKSKITVKYDTKKIGNFNESIFVHTDKSDIPIRLEIRGEVLQPKHSNTKNNNSQKTN